MYRPPAPSHHRTPWLTYILYTIYYILYTIYYILSPAHHRHDSPISYILYTISYHQHITDAMTGFQRLSRIGFWKDLENARQNIHDINGFPVDACNTHEILSGKWVYILYIIIIVSYEMGREERDEREGVRRETREMRKTRETRERRKRRERREWPLYTPVSNPLLLCPFAIHPAGGVL